MARNDNQSEYGGGRHGDEGRGRDDDRQWRQQASSRGRDDGDDYARYDEGQWPQDGSRRARMGDHQQSDRAGGRNRDEMTARDYDHRGRGQSRYDEDDRDGQSWGRRQAGGLQDDDRRAPRYGADPRYGEGRSHGERYERPHQSYAPDYDHGRDSYRHFDSDQGRHRGKGPRNYSRSDDRITDDVNERLTADSEVDASEIDVKVEKGEVTLSGTVESKMAKRRAEDCADSVMGVKHVQNNLRMSDQSGSQFRSESSSQQTAGSGKSG